MTRSHGHFAWYELATTDVKAAEVFYSELMGWTAQHAPGAAYTLFTAQGVSVGGLMELPAEARQMGYRPGWLGYVGVDDVDAAADRVRELGGAVHVPPMDVPDVSRLSVAVDPQMATFALFKWLGRDPPPAANPGAPGRVGWHELFATDWMAAWEFYAALFGWQKASADTSEIGAYQLFSARGQTIGGMFTKSSEVPAPFWLYYFNTGDIDAAMARVKAGGGQIVNGPMEVPGARWIIHCIDPQGAMFALEGTRHHNGIGYFERAAPMSRQSAR